MREPTTEVYKIGKINYTMEIIGEYIYESPIDPLKWHQETLKMDTSYRKLFNPTWDHIITHESLSAEDTLYLSQGVDPLSAKSLAKDLETLINAEDKEPLYDKYQKELDHGLKEYLETIKHNGELRGEEINANYHLFKAHGDRIDRQKYYDWMKGGNKQIPDKFALAPIQKQEPEVIKGNTQSFDEWMVWRIETKQELNIQDFIPYGFKTTLVEETKKRWGYKGDSAVKDSWKRLNISASKDRKTRIVENTP